MRSVSVTRFEVAVAAMGVAVLGLVSRVPGPEELVQLLYLIGIVAASFSAGWLRPASPVRWGVLLQAAQPPALAIFMAVTGAFSQPPATSTGGAAVALAIFTSFCLLLIGLTVASASLGAYVRGGRNRSRAGGIGEHPPAG